MGAGVQTIVITVIAMIVVPFLMGIGMFLYYTSHSTISSLDLGETGNSTLATLNTNVWNGFNVLSPLPIILGASAIISVLLGAFIWYKTR